MKDKTKDLSFRLGEYYRESIKSSFPTRRALDNYYERNKTILKEALIIMEILDITYGELKTWLYGEGVENK